MLFLLCTPFVKRCGLFVWTECRMERVKWPLCALRVGSATVFPPTHTHTQSVCDSLQANSLLAVSKQEWVQSGFSRVWTVGVSSESRTVKTSTQQIVKTCCLPRWRFEINLTKTIHVCASSFPWFKADRRHFAKRSYSLSFRDFDEKMPLSCFFGGLKLQFVCKTYFCPNSSCRFHFVLPWKRSQHGQLPIKTKTGFILSVLTLDAWRDQLCKN